MKKSIMRKWVTALRSGKYRQGIEALVSGKPGRAEHCCLGVLCALSPWKNTYDRIGRWSSRNIYLPDQVAEWAGMDSVIGQYGNSSRSLVDLNDRGTSFEEIADIIEQNYEAL